MTACLYVLRARLKRSRHGISAETGAASRTNIVEMALRRLGAGLAIMTLLLSAACSDSKAQSAAAPGNDSLVFRNFTLIDGTDRPAVPGSAMIVSAGRVTWVGPANALKAPADAKLVDLTGKYVMPGLIDLHVHLGNVVDLTQDSRFYTRENVEKDLRTYASYGVTTVQSMGTDSDAIFPLRAEQRTGRPTVARVYTAGQGLVFKGGYGGVPGQTHPVATVEEAVAEVDAQAAKGADIIKLWLDDELGTMPKMPSEMSKAIIDAAHRHKLKAYGHIFYLEDARRLVDQGIDGLVHSVRDKPVDQALIDAMKAHGTVQIAETLSREASMFAYATPDSFLKDRFFTRSLSPNALALLGSSARRQSIADGPHFHDYPQFFEMAKANTLRLIKAGVPYGFGTDSGPPGRFPGYFSHWELELLVESGLSPAQALVTATGGAARILGAGDIGILEPGRWADLIVLDADPLADIRNSRTIRAVYIAGQPVAGAAL